MNASVTLRCAEGCTVEASKHVLGMASRVLGSLILEEDPATPVVIGVDDFPESAVRLFVDTAGLMAFDATRVDLSDAWLIGHLGTARRLVEFAHKYDAGGVMAHMHRSIASWAALPGYLSTHGFLYLPVTQVAIDCICFDPDNTDWMTDKIMAGLAVLIAGPPRKWPYRPEDNPNGTELGSPNYDALPYSVRTEVLLWVVKEAELTVPDAAQPHIRHRRAFGLVFPKFT